MEERRKKENLSCPHSYFSFFVSFPDKRAFVMRRKTPSIRSKEITFRLCKALHGCLAVTPTLMFIELTGVPLRERDINVLMKVRVV